MFSDAEAFHQYERFGIDEHGMKVELPLAIELKRFIMEMHDDSITPKRYASEVIIYSKASQHQYAATIDVNKPVEVDGWKIYQKDYRLTEAGEACQVSILELVSDPWLPFVYAGIYMMIAGAVCMFILAQGRRKP
jgi:cytochrome c biogenesis protein ResB